jgi:hypothetical protein
MPFIFRIQKLAMISIHMIMTRSLGTTTPMKTSTVLGALEKWLPIGMASVVLGLLMVPKWEVRNHTANTDCSSIGGFLCCNESKRELGVAHTFIFHYLAAQLDCVRKGDEASMPLFVVGRYYMYLYHFYSIDTTTAWVSIT